MGSRPQCPTNGCTGQNSAVIICAAAHKIRQKNLLGEPGVARDDLMHKPLIYLDQNVVSAQANGKIRIQKPDDSVLVYSKEHFSEIQRAADPGKYLDALESVDAQLVDSEFDASLKETGRTLLIEGVSPQHHFNQYLEAVNEVPYDEEAIYPLIAWVNGGSVLDDLVGMPGVMEGQLSELLATLPNEH